MGILALESELDSAVRILDYCLSCAKSPQAQDIYKYCLSLLSRKIVKTQKKSSLPVVSPVPISVNKYSVLSVEDCSNESPVFNVTSASSKGVPTQGLAPEVKLSVLNSLSICSELSSPSSPLAPEEPESPAGTEEVVSSLNLQRSFTMECEVMVPV